MPGALDILMGEIKHQKGKRYRFVELSSTNVVEKKVRGYDFVRANDPEVKGTALERQKDAAGLIACGDVALARISEEDAQKHDAQVQERLDKKLRAINRGYKQEEENIKRKLGKHHAGFKVIMKEE